MYKKTALILCLSACLLILAGCSGNKAKDAMSVWEENAALDAKQTAGELYEAAKGEGVLNIYTVSSRLFDVAESFQKQYPGLLVEVNYLRAEEMTEKIKQNHASESYDCDLLFITNGDG
ncbi:MAG: YgdI/YgdR family lipoprotein, partial [Lachnospiraceae bacterium]|nr:YgdI/YgdR family lipoprotein [Lachnospiraceae bacterium]